MPNNITKISETEIGVQKVDVISKDQIRNELTELNNQLLQILDNKIDVEAKIAQKQSLLDEADALNVKFSEEI